MFTHKSIWFLFLNVKDIEDALNEICHLTSYSSLISGCKGLMELVVIIDGSDSINFPDYSSLKISMTNLVQQLDIQETEIRISFVVFSSDIALETPLMGDKQKALQTAATLPHPRDGTNTWMALESMA